MSITLRYYFDDDEFDYEVTPTYNERLEMITSGFSRPMVNYKGEVLKQYTRSLSNTEGLAVLSVLEDLDMIDELDKCLLESDCLKEFYYDAAREHYNDCKAESEDPWGSRGISQKDFI